MAFHTFGPGLALDKITTLGLSTVTAKVEDADTGEPLQAYTMDDPATPTQLTTNRYGYFPEFRAPDTARRVRLTFGNLALDQIAHEVVEAASTAVEDVDAFTDLYAQQVTEQEQRVGNVSDRLESVEVLAGLAPGDTSDATVKSHIINPASQTSAALSAAIGESVDTLGTPARNALDAAFVGSDSDPLQPLDLWPEFNADGGTGSWIAKTYADYIAGVKSAFAGPISSGSIIETDRGVGSNGIDRIYSYRAGSGPLKALIVSGLHADELLCHFVGLRWFQAFATSKHPAMVALRGRITVEWIACANPSGYNAIKENANGVNLNRNFKFYETTSVAPNKGTAPFSEVESQIVKTIVDEGNLCVIDLHSRGPVGTNDIGWSAGSAWIAADRSVPFGAMETFRRVYSDVAGGPPVELLIPYEPTLNNWALWYGRWDGTRPGNTAMLLETATDHFGSTASLLSSDAAKAMCGFITTYLGMWVNKGLTPAPAYASSTMAIGPDPTTAGSISGGGPNIDSGAWYPLKWGTIAPSAGGTATTEIKFVCPFPAQIEILAEGYYQLTAVGTTPVWRGSVGLSMDDAVAPHPSSVNNSNVDPTNAGTNARSSWATSMRYSDVAPDGATVHTARLWFIRNSGNSTVRVGLARMWVKISPIYDTYPHPTVRQGA